LKHVIVFGISASAFESTRQKSLAAGCQDFLTKPIHVETFLEKIGQHLCLEWTNAQQESQTPPAAPDTLTLPPEDDLLALLKDARSGDILEIRNRIADLEQRDDAYRPFTTNIRELAGRFQINHIRSLLETYLDEGLHHTEP
jgi:hypothetical protein